MSNVTTQEEIVEFLKQSLEAFPDAVVYRSQTSGPWISEFEQFLEQTLRGGVETNLKETPHLLDFLSKVDLEKINDDASIEFIFFADYSYPDCCEYIELNVFLNRECLIGFKYFVELKYGFSKFHNWKEGEHEIGATAAQLILQNSKNAAIKKLIISNLDIFCFDS